MPITVKFTKNFENRHLVDDLNNENQIKTIHRTRNLTNDKQRFNTVMQPRSTFRNTLHAAAQSAQPTTKNGDYYKMDIGWSSRTSKCFNNWFGWNNANDAAKADVANMTVANRLNNFTVGAYKAVGAGGVHAVTTYTVNHFSNAH